MIGDNVTSIEKETIASLIFSDKEVLSSQVERNIRSRKIYRAMLLGNNFKHKARITFSTTNCIYQVNTTIWSATDNFIILKGGIIIPVSTVWDIEMM